MRLCRKAGPVYVARPSLLYGGRGWQVQAAVVQRSGFWVTFSWRRLMTFEEESVADEKEVSECNRELARRGNLSMSTHEGFCQLQPQNHASVHICQSTAGCLAFGRARKNKTAILYCSSDKPSNKKPDHSPTHELLIYNHPSQTHALTVHLPHLNDCCKASLQKKDKENRQTHAMFTTNSNTKEINLQPALSSEEEQCREPIKEKIHKKAH